MNKHLCTILLLTSTLQLAASGASASAAATSAPKTPDAEGKSVAAATLAPLSKRDTLYASYAKAYAEKIQAAEDAIVQELIRMGKPITQANWQRQKQFYITCFQQSDDLLAKVIQSKTPLRALKRLWYVKYPDHAANKREPLKSMSSDKAQDLQVFVRARLLLQSKSVQGAHSEHDFYDFVAQNESSISEPEFVDPDSAEGKVAAQTLADFGVHGTRLLRGNTPDEVTLLARSRHLILVQPAFLTKGSPYKELLAAGLAHEIHHIIFADAHNNSALATLITLQGISPYRMPQFQKYKIVTEQRADALAASKADPYLQGLLQFIRMRKAAGEDADAAHIPYDQREALLLTIQKQLSAQEVVSVPLAAKKEVRACNACAKQGESFQCCGRCRKVYYCGKNCQAKDWAKHKETCIPK